MRNLLKSPFPIIGTLLIIIILTIGFAFTDSEAAVAAAPPPPSLPVLTIGGGTVATDASYPVSIQGTVDLEIRPQVSGNLERVYVDEGTFVNKGVPLFKINEQPYREQLNNALANQHSAEAALINAQLEIDKLTPLVQNKVVSEFQLKSAKAAYKIAAANVDQSKAMAASARINLGYTLITAPVSGYIGRLPKKQGSLISATDPEPLTKLSDVHEVYAYFSLGETDFINFREQYSGNSLNEKIKNLPPVTLELADNKIYAEKGRIDMVDGQFDKNTGAITLRATFPNAKGLLRSGNTGKVRLSIAHENSIVVPQEATVEIQDKVFVFTVDKNNKVSKQPIIILGKSGTDYLVQDGVKTGDRIVFKGFENLQEGTVIVPEASPKILAKK